MSWMFSLIKKNSKFRYNEKAVSSIHPQARYLLNNSRLYLAAGGLKGTCSSNINNITKSSNIECFVAIGLGIIYSNNKFSFIERNDWENILNNENTDLNYLNGHFVTMLIKNKTIVIRNDQLGLRNLFYLETDDFIGISTRLDWLTKIVNNSEINFESYSSFWNLINCLSYKSIIKGIKQLNPGGRITINENNEIKVSFKYWHPNSAASIQDYDTIDMLRDLTLFPMEHDKTINLALSGGIDSRTLLSFLLNKDKTKWATLTWGKKDLPDAVIAQKLAEYYKFKHKMIYEPFQKEEDCISNLYNYVSETYSILPAYTCKELGYYDSIDNKPIFVDGGSGALFRRVVGNKMLLKGKKFLIDRDIENSYSIMKEPKADIFNQYTNNLMHNLTLEDIDKMFYDMPQIKDFGKDNWIDLLSIRYYKTINGTITQSRMDNYLTNYMPFLQPSLLKMVFNVSEKHRRSEIMNKKILKEHNHLTKFPIVKYDTIIPFTLNLYAAYGMAKIKKIIKKYPISNLDTQFLDKIPNFVQDRIRSKAVIDHSHYDLKKIKFMIDEYYGGNKEYSKQINWWLSYDVWREIISEKSVL
ncbi:MAG: asparagine synthase-related protein [Candidatus Cloacimonadota bacterium]|nr:asparagine synthase-related protein [Candidatus Cloacimonadota bacterium]